MVVYVVPFAVSVHKVLYVVKPVVTAADVTAAELVMSDKAELIEADIDSIVNGIVKLAPEADTAPATDELVLEAPEP